MRMLAWGALLAGGYFTLWAAMRWSCPQPDIMSPPTLLVVLGGLAIYWSGIIAPRE